MIKKILIGLSLIVMASGDIFSETIDSYDLIKLMKKECLYGIKNGLDVTDNDDLRSGLKFFLHGGGAYYYEIETDQCYIGRFKRHGEFCNTGAPHNDCIKK